MLLREVCAQYEQYMNYEPVKGLHHKLSTQLNLLLFQLGNWVDFNAFVPL